MSGSNASCQALPPVTVALELTNQLPRSLSFPVFLADQMRLIHAVREAGWDAISTSQHFLTEDLQMLQPVPFLSALATQTGQMRLELGLLLLTLLNPVEVAENLATLDVICGGRLVLVVGLGYRDSEYAAFGIAKRDRVRRFEANLELLLRLWGEDPVSVDLPWCQLSEATISVKPVQVPRPQVWVGANADNAVRRAARLGDSWYINPHATTETVLRQLDIFRSERRLLGLAPPTTLPMAREIFCGPSREQALSAAAPWLRRKYEVYGVWGQAKVLPGHDSFDGALADLAEQRFIIGTPDDCLAELLEWRRLGVNHFSLRTSWLDMPAEVALTSIDLLNREVLPVLRSSGS
jgi:alkanesulfonate monooxygenase SsuD/methylene tetrahydromethanopterin reductase-like flavin-dependent oxidoreductase (luciferase family)